MYLLCQPYLGTLPLYCTIPPPYPYIPGSVVVGVGVGVVVGVGVGVFLFVGI